MGINANVSNAAAYTVPQQGQNDDLMDKLSQIVSNNTDSAASGSDVKNEDLALKESLSTAVQQQMGDPDAPAISDPVSASSGLSGSLSSEQSFQALLGKVMSVLIQSSTEQSAHQREQRSVEINEGLKNSLDAAKELRTGAQQALVTSMISSGVSLGMGIGSMGMSVKSMKNTSQAADLKGQASKLQNPTMDGLATASSPELASKPMDVAEAGGGSIDSLKESLMNKALKKEQDSVKLNMGSDGLSKLGMASGSVGASVASSQMSQASAAQSEQEAYARRDQSEMEVASEWQNRMGDIRNQMLQILQEINRTNAASQASAFRNM